MVHDIHKWEKLPFPKSLAVSKPFSWSFSRLKQRLDKGYYEQRKAVQ